MLAFRHLHWLAFGDLAGYAHALASTQALLRCVPGPDYLVSVRMYCAPPLKRQAPPSFSLCLSLPVCFFLLSGRGYIATHCLLIHYRAVGGGARL